MQVPKVDVREIRLHERPVRLRLPFKFGIVTLTEAPQAFVRVRVAVEGLGEARGQAAELMVPKWFDKNPNLSNEQNFDQLRLALGLARDIRLAAPAQTPFAHYASSYAEVVATGRENRLDPLVAHYGPAVIDRAILDALCRILNMSFPDAIRSNLPGLTAEGFARDLDGFDLNGFLASLTFRQSIHARHTVGMADALTEGDIDPRHRVGDGLPETLEEVIRAYGQTYFKIKILRDVGENVARMESVAALLDRSSSPYHVTVDGNELFEDGEGVVELWRAMKASPKLARFTGSVLWIEQPIARARTFDVDMSALAAECPVMIDEADADIDAFPRARALGYHGVSSKICKGFYKSLLNAARVRYWNGAGRDAPCFLSGEDLTCQAGICMQQDLALMALLGAEHVEKNGHHFGRGMDGAPESEQQAFLAAHRDLYRRQGDVTTLRIEEGRIAIGSLNCVGYASGAEPDWDSLAEMPMPATV